MIEESKKSSISFLNNLKRSDMNILRRVVERAYSTSGDALRYVEGATGTAVILR